MSPNAPAPKRWIDRHGARYEIRERAGPASSRLIAECWSEEEAYRILAAPDLVEACRRIAADGYGTAIGDLEFLKAAIAKTKPKEPCQGCGGDPSDEEHQTACPACNCLYDTNHSCPTHSIP